MLLICNGQYRSAGDFFIILLARAHDAYPPKGTLPTNTRFLTYHNLIWRIPCQVTKLPKKVPGAYWWITGGARLANA